MEVMASSSYFLCFLTFDLQYTTEKYLVSSSPSKRDLLTEVVTVTSTVCCTEAKGRLSALAPELDAAGGMNLWEGAPDLRIFVPVPAVAIAIPLPLSLSPRLSSSAGQYNICFEFSWCKGLEK